MGVIAFHILPNRVAGGWLGVPLFFVLSGYLITDLLIQEYEQTDALDVKAFWIQRLRRLYPALVTMLLTTSAVILVVFPQLIYNLRYIVVTNLLYIYNFWAMKHGVSYFDQFGGASPFTHLWSLSIEGQFYLFWPFIVGLLLKSRLKRYVISILLSIGAVGSAFLMAILYQSQNINRVYYGTDTRMFAILLGTALAFVWPSNHLATKLTGELRIYLNIIGSIALLDTILAFMVMDGQSALTYKWGMMAMTIVMTVMVAVVIHPASWFSQALNQPWLNYLGKRSYSTYLYQLPVFVFYEKLVPNYHFSIVNVLVQVGIVLILSELSYRWIETPLRHQKNWQAISAWLLSYRPLRYGTGLVMATILVCFGIGLAQPEAGQAAPKSSLQKNLENNQKKIDRSNKLAQSGSETITDVTELSEQQKQLLRDYDLTETQYRLFNKKVVTAVGDSVMLDVAPKLQELNSKLSVDAEVGRQPTNAITALIPQLVNHKETDAFLLGLGTNGDIQDTDIDNLMAALNKKQTVYWVNNYVPSKPWQDSNNQKLNQAAKRYSNFQVIDWYDLVKNHPEWLASDGIHPGPTGNLNYAHLVVETMTKNNR